MRTAEASSYPPSRDAAAPLPPVHLLGGLFLFAVTCIVAGIGARLGKGNIGAGFLRSVHLVDVLLPFIILFVIAYWSRLAQLLAPATRVAILLWCGFVFMVAPIGHLLIATAGDKTLALSFLFAVKEIEFIAVFLLAAIFVAAHPLLARVAVWGVCVALALWAVKEVVRPTGLYYIGLPFERGPSQAGLVFSLFAFLWLIATDGVRLPQLPRWCISLVVGGVFALLAMGSVGSLSRSGNAALAAGLAILVIGRPRIMVALTGLTLLVGAFWLVSDDPGSKLGTDQLVLVDRWSAALDNFPDRVAKWRDMIAFQLAHPATLPFGAGFGSPNEYVLNQPEVGLDLGLILAVDSGYVRRLFEVGVAGFILYFGMLLLIVRDQLSGPSRLTSLAAFATLLIGAIPLEAFQVTQNAVSYFLLAGTVIGLGFRARLAGTPKTTIRIAFVPGPNMGLRLI